MGVRKGIEAAEDLKGAKISGGSIEGRNTWIQKQIVEEARRWTRSPTWSSSRCAAPPTAAFRRSARRPDRRGEPLPAP